MARGGSRGRRTNYVRDNSGRFASTPGGGPPKRSTPAIRRAAMRKAKPTVTGGTLGARGSLRRSRAKLAGKNPADRSLRGTLGLRAQKGAVTRGANRLEKVRAASTVRMAGKGPAGTIRGNRKAAARPVATTKPSTPARKPAALKWEKPAGFGGRRQTASLPGGRRVNVYSDGKGTTASIFSERDRSPVMVRKDFRNVTEAKKWAANPSARGPRILGRYQPSMKRRKAWEMPTDASPSLANIQGKKARPSGTIAKPRDLKPGAIAARKGKPAPTPRKPSPKGAGPRMKAARPAGTVAKPRGMKPGVLAARRGVKVSAEQRAIATAYKKQINSRNIRATRAMLRAVAKDQGYTGKDAIRRLTQTLDRGYSGGPLGGMAKPLPLNRQRGNAYSARKSRELGLNRRFSDALWIASPTTKRTSAAYDLADETLSGRHTRSALKAAAQQSRRRAGKPRRR